jgi:hypothetical protein
MRVPQAAIAWSVRATLSGRAFAFRGRRLEPLLAALMGGFAGALVTGGLSAWHEHRRNRRALRAAARLVAGELRTIESRLHAAVASRSWRELAARPLGHGEWDEHRGSFASQLSLERWVELDGAYRLVHSVNAAAGRRAESERLTEVDREVLETGARSAGSAAALLEAGSLTGADRPGGAARRTRRPMLRHP